MSETQTSTKYQSKEDRAQATASVEDIVRVAKDGSARRPDAKFLSDHELSQIEANQDLIREGVEKREATDLEPAFREPVFKESIEEVARTIDGLEEHDKNHDTELSELKTRIDELEKMLVSENEELKLAIRELIVKIETVSPEKSDNEVEEKQPGKELELWKGEDDSDEETDENSFNPEIPDELKDALEQATDKYAELSAKHRNGHFGHLLRQSKFIAKIPGVKWLAERANDITDGGLNDARKEYQLAVQQIQSAITGQLELGHASKEDIRNETAKFGLQHEAVFEAKAVAERTQRSKKTNGFVEWWVKQEGWKGKAKKALVVGAAGVTAGLTAGLAVPFIGSAVAGGATGGLIARHVTKRRANTTGGEEQTLAQRQSAEDLARKQEYHDNQIASDNYTKTDVEGFTEITEDRTAGEKAGNRRRMKSAVAVGAAAGGIGGRIADVFHSSDQAANAATKSSPESTGRTQMPLEQQPSKSELIGNNFIVEPGNGYTHELIDFAQTNGHNLNPKQAWELHQHLMGKFGGDYIDIAKHATDTYVQNGDVRLVAPGKASWDPGVGEAARQWMTGRGLW